MPASQADPAVRRWRQAATPIPPAASEQQFAEGDASSYDFGQTVFYISRVDAATVRLAMAFTSLQAPDKGANGDTCDNWALEYTMI